MNEADEAIERVLKGFREVEAAPGLEQRLERRLREVVRERGVRGWFGGWRWVGVGCVAMLLVGVGVSLRRQGKHEVLAPQAGLVREQALSGEDGVSQRSKPLVGHSSKAGASRRMNELRGSEAAEVLETSFPAPPLPLTEQERLLLRVAERGGPEEVAMLYPVIEDGNETAAFLEFFGKPEAVQQINQGESR